MHFLSSNSEIKMWGGGGGGGKVNTECFISFRVLQCPLTQPFIAPPQANLYMDFHPNPFVTFVSNAWSPAHNQKTVGQK